MVTQTEWHRYRDFVDRQYNSDDEPGAEDRALRKATKAIGGPNYDPVHDTAEARQDRYQQLAQRSSCLARATDGCLSILCIDAIPLEAFAEIDS